jgi:hypothetical protein
MGGGGEDEGYSLSSPCQNPPIPPPPNFKSPTAFLRTPLLRGGGGMFNYKIRNFPRSPFFYASPSHQTLLPESIRGFVVFVLLFFRRWQNYVEALLGCGVAQIVARRLAVRQARVRISARHPRGGPPPCGSNEDNKSGSLRVVYINIVCLLD